VEECKSAEEFLLEPWVLLQLPFEPTILHQWTVALMVEALQFQKKITDFTTMAYPEHLKNAVDKLTEIGSLLLNGANTFLSFIAKLINSKDDSKNHMHATATLYWEEFQQILPQVLPALKFALSEDGDTLISTLKRMAWSENAAARTCKSKINFKMIPSFYTLAYWESHKVQKCLFPKSEFKVDDPVTLMIKYQKIAAFWMPCDFDQFLKKLIEDKIIDSGRIRGESREVILETAARYSSALEVFSDHYNRYISKCKNFPLSNRALKSPSLRFHTEKYHC
jgi:hypothetical protein